MRGCHLHGWPHGLCNWPALSFRPLGPGNTHNVRFSPADLEYIINYAQDRVIFIDEDLLPLLEPLVDMIPCVELLVICRHGEGGESSFPNTIQPRALAPGPMTLYCKVVWPSIPVWLPIVYEGYRLGDYEAEITR